VGGTAACYTTRHVSPPCSTHFRTPRLAFLASSCSEPPRSTLLALRPSSGRITGMLQIRFYNRRFASRAPAVKPPSLETSSRAPWETRRRSPSRSSLNMTLPPLFSEDAGPPRGHPASSGTVLDGTLPASGQQAVALRLRASRAKRSSFFGCLRALPVEPSDTRFANKKRSAERPSPFAEPVTAGSTSMLPLLASPGVPSAGEVQNKHPRGHLRRSSAPVGRQAPELHVFIDVRKLRLDPFSRRFRGRFVAACASSASADRCFNEHDNGPLEHPGPAESVGRDGCRDRSLPFDRGQTAEGTQGQGSRITEPRRSLPGLLPEETLPQPRSLQTPRVAGIARRPVRS
jgi:hypothetical protein